MASARSFNFVFVQLHCPCAGRGPKRKAIPEDAINEVKAGPQSRQDKPNTAEAEDWLGPPLIKEEPADPSRRGKLPDC